MQCVVGMPAAALLATYAWIHLLAVVAPYTPYCSQSPNKYAMSRIQENVKSLRDCLSTRMTGLLETLVFLVAYTLLKEKMLWQEIMIHLLTVLSAALAKVK